MPSITDPVRSPHPDPTGAAERTSQTAPRTVGAAVAPLPVDAFQPAKAGDGPALQGTAQPVRPVQELRPSLDKVAKPEDVAARFGPDLALLLEQLVHPRLSALEGLSRAWTLFTDYAERFVTLRGDLPPVWSGERPTEGREASAQRVPVPPGVAAAFVTALQEAGLKRLRDQRTGEDALTVAQELISAPTVFELRRRADAIQWVLTQGPGGEPLAAPLPGTPQASSTHTHSQRSDEQPAPSRPQPWLPSVWTRIRRKLFREETEKDERLETLFWTGVLALCGLVGIILLLRYLLGL